MNLKEIFKWTALVVFLWMVLGGLVLFSNFIERQKRCGDFTQEEYMTGKYPTRCKGEVEKIGKAIDICNE